MRPVGEAHQRRDVEARAWPCGHPGLEPHPAFVEGERAQILAFQPEHVVEPDVRGMLLEHLGRHGLAVEALLQVVERSDGVVAPHEQFAVEHALEIDRLDDVRKGAQHVFTGAAEEALHAARGSDLYADAVPFPFGAEVRRIEPVDLGAVDRVGQHRREEGTAHVRGGLRTVGRQPVEQGTVGRREAVPDLLDFGDGLVADIGHGLLGQTGRHTDTQCAGQQLEQGPASGRIELVEPALQDRGRLHFGRALQGLDHFAQGRGRAGIGFGLPDQCQGLGEIADIVVGQMEQLLADLLLAETAQQRGLGRGEVEPAGQRRECPAAVGIGRLA